MSNWNTTNVSNCYVVSLHKFAVKVPRLTLQTAKYVSIVNEASMNILLVVSVLLVVVGL